MSDTVVRVIVEGANGQPLAGGGPASNGTLNGTAAPVGGSSAAGGPPLGSATRQFDATEAALGRMLREAQKRETESEYRRLSGLPQGPRVDMYRPGMAPPKIQQAKAAAKNLKGVREPKELTGAQKLAKGFTIAAAAAESFAQILGVSIRSIQAETRAIVAEVGRNENVAARIERRQSAANKVETGFTVGGGTIGGVVGTFLGGPVGTAVGIGLGTTIGNAAGKIATSPIGWKNAEEQQMLGADAALRERFQKLGQFGGQINAALARQRMSEFRRNLGEASALGPEGAQLIGRQTENDRLNQTLGAIKSLQQAREQDARLAKENEKLRKEIAELTKTVKGAKAVADKINRGGKTPLQKMLEGLTMPDDGSRERRRRQVQGLMDQQINNPVFGG